MKPLIQVQAVSQRFSTASGEFLALQNVSFDIHEGETVSLSRLAEVLPNDESLYQSVVPHLIGEDSHSIITGGGIWPEPNAFTPGVDKRSFFWARNAEGKLDFSNDYNAEGSAGYHNESWYQHAKGHSQNSCLWSDVYQDASSGVNMVTCSIPYQLAGKFAGVATTDIRLDNVATFMQQQGNSTGGYAFVVDKQGQILYFPQADQTKYKTFSDLAQSAHWLAPVEAGLKSLRATDGVKTITLESDNVLNAPSRVMLFPMADTGWVVGLVTGNAHRWPRQSHDAGCAGSADPDYDRVAGRIMAGGASLDLSSR